MPWRASARMRRRAGPWGVSMSHHSGSSVRRVDLTLTIAHRGQLARSAVKSNAAFGSQSMRIVLVTERAVACGFWFIRVFLSRLVGEGLEVVAVRVDHKRGVIAGAVVGAQARLAVVPSSRGEGCRMELVDGLSARRGQPHMHGRRRIAGFCEPKLQGIFRAETRAAFVRRELGVAQRSECTFVKRRHCAELFRAKSDMVDHGAVLLLWVGSAFFRWIQVWSDASRR